MTDFVAMCFRKHQKEAENASTALGENDGWRANRFFCINRRFIYLSLTGVILSEKSFHIIDIL